MPGTGTDDGSEAQRCNTTKSTRAGGRSDDEQRRRGHAELRAHAGGYSQIPSEMLGRQPHLLTSRDVHSASSEQVSLWASTPAVVRALLAAACTRTEGTVAATYGTDESVGSTKSRDAVCALLRTVFKNSFTENNFGDDGRINGSCPLIVLDQWYGSFCSLSAPFGGENGVLQEPPRLLLEGMLEIPAVKDGFVRRGLLRYLAEGLRKSWAENASWREACDYSNSPRGECCCSEQLPKHADAQHSLWTEEIDTKPTVSMNTTRGFWPGGHVTDPPNSSEKHFQGVPWWLFAPGGGRESDAIWNKNGGRADADTRGSTELDESCKTVSDGGFVPDEGGSGPSTSREDGPTDDDGGTGNGLASGATWPVCAEAKRGLERKQREREGGDCVAGISSRERIAPPMLRLDALDRSLGPKEWATPRSGSPNAAVTLSAASTTAPANWVGLFVLRFTALLFVK